MIAARDRGIYVSVMLFDGWGISEYRSTPHNTTWNYHPFNAANNINGINGDPNNDGIGVEYHTLQIAAIKALQETYVRKVVDTVNDLDNVLYEICNESGNYSTEWQYHLISFIKSYEATKSKKHPVGMTFQYSDLGSGTNANLSNSPADWISPGTGGTYWDNPPSADGSIGSEYSVYQPAKGNFTVDLKNAAGDFNVEWFDISIEKAIAGEAIKGGGIQEFTPPGDGPMLLHLMAKVRSGQK